MAKYNVLIIDDAFFIRNLIKKAIAKKPTTNNNTFEVIGEAQDGRAGIDLCESLKPDIITVDFNIPSINGLDFAKYLKELHPEIPIIMISSNLDPDFAGKVKAARCRLLTKPFQEAYLWKVLDESVEEILNTDVTQVKPKINEEAQKILDELAEEMKGEIVPLTDEGKDISAKGLADKNIGVTKAKNVGFDYSGAVLDIKTEKRRMSSDLFIETEKKPVVEPVIPDIPYSQVDNDVDLEDEDDFIIDLEAVENQRESEYGKTGIEELEDEEFLFIEDEDDESADAVNLDLEKQETPTETLMLDFTKQELDDGDDDAIFLVDDEDDDDNSEMYATPQISKPTQKYDALLSSVTFNYYDYLGSLLYTVQNVQKENSKPDISIKVEKEQPLNTPTRREETAEEEFDRLFKEFNGGNDVHFDNPNSESAAAMPNNETIINRDREHISIDPPKDDSIFRVYGSKLTNVTSSEMYNNFNPVIQHEEAPVQKKGFFAKLFDKIFGRNK